MPEAEELTDAQVAFVEEYTSVFKSRSYFYLASSMFTAADVRRSYVEACKPFRMN